MRRFQPRAGFKLIELVIVVSIIGILCAMIPPALQKMREAANISTCQNNLKQIGVTIHTYASANRDVLPPMLDYDPTGVGWSPFWFSLIPYIESNTGFYGRARGTGAGWNGGNHTAVIKSNLCPSDASHNAGLCTSGAAGWAGTSYAPVYQLFGSENVYDKKRKAHITQGKYTLANHADGTSNQVAVVERFTSFPDYNASNATYYPMSHSYWGWNINGSVYGVWGLKAPQTKARSYGVRAAHPYHPNSAHVTLQALRLDGSVVSISSAVNVETTWFYLCTPDDGNVAGGCY